LFNRIIKKAYFAKLRYTQGSPDEAYEKVKDELQPNVPKKVPVPEAVAIIPVSILFSTYF